MEDQTPDWTLVAHIAPPDKRPYRLASAPGDERTYTQNGVRATYRQIGWHGQSGALYALGEDPSSHEPGSFSPLWLCVGVETVEEPEEPGLDMELEEIRTGAAMLGRIAGRAEVAALVHRRAYYDAAHAELQFAGLCDCDEETAPEEKPPLSPDEVHQRIRDAFSQLSKAAQHWLRPNPTDPAGRASQANQDSGEPAPTNWCGDPDHTDPCDDCDAVLADASDALRQRMPTTRPGSSHAAA